MIAPVRNAYSQRVAGSRVAAGARNVAKTSDMPNVERAAQSKRTGAQEESLLHEGAEGYDAGSGSDDSGGGRERERSSSSVTAGVIDGSLAWNERLRATAEAYRYTLDNLDPTPNRLKPGGVYDAPS